MTEPLYPAMHVQPWGTLAPELTTGHGTAEHVLTKKGVDSDATTLPEKPALHVQPATTFVPAELAGQATARQKTEVL